MARRRKQLQIPLVAACIVAAIWLAYLLWPARRDAALAPVCDNGPTVPGIDVSYYQEAIAWKRVRRAGVRYAFIRVSDGRDLVDERFARNWTGAKQAGVMRGAYQYFRPEQDVASQADLMIRMVGKDRGELPPVIDVETHGGLAPDVVVARTQAWVARVREKLGVEPIVYTGPEFWRDRAKSGDVSSQPLWIAHYTQGCPSVPKPWTRWTFWQHTDNGRVPGIEGPVDLDLFAGSLQDLERFARDSVRETSAAR